MWLRPENVPGADVVIADIFLFDESGARIAEITGFRLQRTSRRVRHLLSRQDTWMYRLEWQVQKELAGLETVSSKAKHWLILADDVGVGDELAMRLERSGDSVSLLSCHQIYDDGEAALLIKIDECISAIPSPLYGIIHLWSLSTPSDIVKNKMEAANHGCNSALYLVQVLSKQLAALPRLWLVTRGAQQVITGEPVVVEQSPLWGFGKVVGFEFPDLKCNRIDLDPFQSNAENANQLFKQISWDDSEDQIAFRNGVGFALRLLPFTFTRSLSLPARSLRGTSTYLVTGGLGGLGLHTAKWMISRGAKHLVLLGRNEPSIIVRSELDKMRKDGVEIVIAQADISDYAQLKRVFDRIESAMPKLGGVVHAAGVLDDGSLLNLNAERMSTVMSSKVDGTWNLHNLTVNLPLDFFVLFSSAVSVLGSPGQANYAAASAYLDAMAYYRRNLGLPAISINWGPWAEIGLAAEATQRLREQNGSTQHLIKVIAIDDGLEILEQLLTEPTAQVMVLPFNLQSLLELYPKAAGMPFLSEIGSKNSYVARLYARPMLRQDYVAPRNETERKLAELWRQTLHIDRVGVHDSFFELGGDSVLAAQILALAQKTFGVRINPQDAFKAFTIDRLAEMLAAEILIRIEEMSEEEAEQRLSK